MMVWQILDMDSLAQLPQAMIPDLDITRLDLTTVDYMRKTSPVMREQVYMDKANCFGNKLDRGIQDLCEIVLELGIVADAFNRLNTFLTADMLEVLTPMQAARIRHLMGVMKFERLIDLSQQLDKRKQNALQELVLVRDHYVGLCNTLYEEDDVCIGDFRSRWSYDCL
ncbi:hypothetical protein N7532_009353 [Penicillium argentinense]|uniref:Uncharacterized protein n=1 Tax=Penicillium argentinense TaxID=1131581 RepID=A0A9W9EZC7_9EURO|nr:uncharacterized protein N7532_009353 [Penicillium argentinense]KAJ5090669.1 hypothetical protein N7532_009353 [Penicillium argentinense]